MLLSFCFYVSSFVLSLLHKHLKGANNHQAGKNIQNVDSEIGLGWMKILSVIIGQKNILQKYNISEKILRRQELLNQKK